MTTLDSSIESVLDSIGSFYQGNDLVDRYWHICNQYPHSSVVYSYLIPTVKGSNRYILYDSILKLAKENGVSVEDSDLKWKNESKSLIESKRFNIHSLIEIIADPLNKTNVSEDDKLLIIAYLRNCNEVDVINTIESALNNFLSRDAKHELIVLAIDLFLAGRQSSARINSTLSHISIDFSESGSNSSFTLLSRCILAYFTLGRYNDCLNCLLSSKDLHRLSDLSLLSTEDLSAYLGLCIMICLDSKSSYELLQNRRDLYEICEIQFPLFQAIECRILRDFEESVEKLGSFLDSCEGRCTFHVDRHSVTLASKYILLKDILNNVLQISISDVASMLSVSEEQAHGIILHLIRTGAISGRLDEEQGLLVGRKENNLNLVHECVSKHAVEGAIRLSKYHSFVVSQVESVEKLHELERAKALQELLTFRNKLDNFESVMDEDGDVDKRKKSRIMGNLLSHSVQNSKQLTLNEKAQIEALQKIEGGIVDFEPYAAFFSIGECDIAPIK